MDNQRLAIREHFVRVLATIEFAWSAAVMLLEKSDLQSWTSALVRKIMWIGAFYALLLNGRVWIPAIIDSFEQIGQSSSGFAGISPSAVFAQGMNIAGANGCREYVRVLHESGTCIAVMIRCSGSSSRVLLRSVLSTLLLVVESYIVVAAGVIFLGFGGSRWTTPYVERYIGLGVSTGIKIMLLYMLIGVGMSLSGGWLNEAEESEPLPIQA